MNESSSQDAAPDEASNTAMPTSTEKEGGALAVAGEPPIAPGVERLGRPSGTSQAIPETILESRPSPMFLAVVALIALVADVATKLWAEQRLEGIPGHVTVIENHLVFVLAKNRGGAWGLLQNESENVRRPFFLLVSVAAIVFIVTLYRRLQARQRALKWGLPLVLGGALGNVFDRVRYGHVIDFIDYRADWLRSLNEIVGKYYSRHIVTDHWPTFNVADVAICIGVGLMAVDMLTSRRAKPRVVADVPLEPGPAAEGEAIAPVDDTASAPPKA